MALRDTQYEQYKITMRQSLVQFTRRQMNSVTNDVKNQQSTPISLPGFDAGFIHFCVFKYIIGRLRTSALSNQYVSNR